MMSDKYHFPQTLDEPFKIILWTLDELSVFMIPVLLSVSCFNNIICGLLIGGSLLVGLKKIKGEQGHYFILNLMYWYLPKIISFRKIPASYIREWIG